MSDTYRDIKRRLDADGFRFSCGPEEMNRLLTDYEYLRKQLEAVEAVTELPDRTEMYAESGWDVAMRAVKAALKGGQE